MNKTSRPPSQLDLPSIPNGKKRRPDLRQNNIFIPESAVVNPLAPQLDYGNFFPIEPYYQARINAQGMREFTSDLGGDHPAPTGWEI